MKIKTQFRLMILGIFAVPIICVGSIAIYMHFVWGQEIAGYGDTSAILEQIDVEDRDKLFQFINGINSIGNIAFFSKDFLVIYSSIPEFTSGTVTSFGAISALLVGKDPQFLYSFETPAWEHFDGYILIRKNRDKFRTMPRPFFFPMIVLIGLFLLLITFPVSFSLRIASSITKSVLVLEDATRRAAEGELDVAVSIEGSNEITSLTKSLNKMRNSLREEELRRYRIIMGVTHDLKTPLAIIKAYTEGIEDGITEDPATHTGALEIINAKVDQLEGMINDLLEFVCMDSGEWRGRLKQVDLTTFLRSSAKAFSLDAALFQHQFCSNIVLPENLCVPMDERLVSRALENLVNNAMRYTPDGSSVCLNAALDEGAVVITVSDNGPGIDAADLPHIFEMFYRGSGSRREQGMGLGLAITKWVADCHGWKIGVESKGGACFTIRVPAA
jgi:signal transduction histidine kinase